MMKLYVAAVLASALCLTTPAFADDHPTFDGLWSEATKNPDCTPKDFPDFILVACDKSMTLWYFTKPNHPAHPGVIKRMIVQEKDGSWVAREHGMSFASDEAQPAFKAWLAQIEDLDRQMREDLEKRHAATNPG